MGAMEIERIEGGVTAAKGFMAAGCEANVKYKNRKDLFGCRNFYSECGEGCAGAVG